MRGFAWMTLVAAWFSAGCRDSTGAAGQVNVYLWSEYIDPAIVKDFERETGLRVRRSEYESTQDMMAKLQQAGGAELYDVVIMADHAVREMAEAGLLRPLELDKIPNRVNVAERFANPPYDPRGRYSLPYQWGTVGIMYRPDKIGRIEPSWAALFDPARVAGPFVLLDDMRDLFAAALKFEGHSVNSTDPGQVRSAAELIARAKAHPKCLGFAGGAEGKNKVVSQDAALAIVYNGDALRGISEAPGAAFVIPREGSIIWTDAMTIPAKAPNPDGAHRFINYLLDARVGARLSNYTRFASPNAKALPLINEADRNNPAVYPPQEQLGRMEFLEDLGEAVRRLYDPAWTSVKARS